MARQPTTPPPFPLALRSHFSFLDSTLSVPAIVALARRHGLSAVALCDRGNLHAAVEFMVAARQAGLHPVLGAEIAFRQQPLRLFVANTTGYANLCRILSAHTPAQPRARHPNESCENQAPNDSASPEHPTPPVSRRPLPEFDPTRHATDGLIAVAANPEIAQWFPGHCYRALETRADLRRYAPLPGTLPAVPVVAGHYATPADRWQFDIVQSIRTLTLLRQTHPEKRTAGQYHFRSPAEFEALFGQHPELLEHTAEIANRCQFNLALGHLQFPAFSPPDGTSAHQFLRHLVERGLAARYPAHRHPALRPQLDTELAMIAAVGYEEYFLVVWDLLSHCRTRGIDWITRGSAADSLVCYCLGISGVCPVRFDLYFRRFLNQERMALNKLPDIDVDFPHDRKDDVIDLLFQRYGPAHCAVVGGFSTFQARSAFAEVAKVLGVAEREVRRFTEHFPWGFGGPAPPPAHPQPHTSQSDPREGRLTRLLRASPECCDLPLDEEPFRSALIMAEILDGVPRYAKMHPCGVVLSRQPIHDLTPTFLSQKGYPTTHFDMDAIEAIGLVKMDILAQGGLAVMRDVQNAVAQRGLRLDLDRFTIVPLGEPPIATGQHRSPGLSDPPDLPNPSTLATPCPILPPPVPAPPNAFDDPAIWDLIASGQARAVHHIESPAMTSLCRMTQVRDIDTLVALVSVIRPGAANEDKKREFTRRYQGLSPITYPHPSLEPVLRSTFGLVVYEEHILQICDAFAGLPGGRADLLRRALVKEKWTAVAEIAPEFAAAARARGRTGDEIARVWAAVIGFHGYAFCKAHSAAYGVEAYQSAWLKRHFPADFMAAVLTNGKGFYRPFVYVLECHRLGIPLLPPWVNDPGPNFHVVNNPTQPTQAIRVPVTAIASISRQTTDHLLDEHERAPFASLSDFYLRVHPTREDAETLSRAGTFDGFGSTRCHQFWEIQQLHARWGQHQTQNQSWLLPPTAPLLSPPIPTTNASSPTPPSSPPLDLTEPSRHRRLEWELELLGFPASGHPLDLYPDIAWDTYCPVNRLTQFAGQEVTLCGLVIEDRVHHQSTGEPMKFLTLADRTGMIETELFAQTYKSYGLATIRYPVLELTGRVEPFENGCGHTLRVLRAGKPRTRTIEPESASDRRCPVERVASTSVRNPRWPG
jgi:DNA polymerase-3 subunit alpha